MKNDKAPTIRDIAAHAGVSIATVSRYLNGLQRFSEPVEDEIRRAIKKFGYLKHSQKRDAKGATRTIGVVLRSIRTLQFATVLKGANAIACTQDYALMFLECAGEL